MSHAVTAPSDVVSRLEKAGQAHVLSHWDRLKAADRAALLEQVAGIDWDSLPELIRTYVTGKPAVEISPEDIEPAPYFPKDHTIPGRGWNKSKYEVMGEDLLRQGKVAAFTVAGGQGTRLGFDGPKGAYPGGGITGKPLFACLADWIVAAQKRYGRTIPWYVMTSPINHAATVEFFKQNDYCGLNPRDIMFFSQGVMPSFDMASGRVLMNAPHEIATNPDGHGGSLRALWNSGAINDMRARGVEHISYVQIDNPLARVIDPVFIGLHAFAPDSSGEMSSKMVAKTDPGEKVGVFAKAQGKVRVLEYSDLPKHLAEARNADHTLKFNAGSIAIHMIGVEFVARLNSDGRGGSGAGASDPEGRAGFRLPFHRAEKKVPFFDLSSGQPVNPAKPNAVKLETFVFDAVPMCRSSIVYETDRIDEFAPIKNAEGTDSPETCRRIQTERAARWLERVGVKVPRDERGECQCTIEISPVTAMGAEDLDTARLPKRIEPGQSVVL
ncbi:MAG: UTP--glucose-1-phosphate uridylyltransferase [Planctomycetes bacterium]|nr:UTP--glucose-1-phosphate uridylyltransferase [Planctomycetota bacterium]